MLRLGLLLCHAKRQGAGRVGRFRDNRPNFDYKVQEDLGVKIMKSSKFTRRFVCYPAAAAHFQEYIQSSKVHPESKAQSRQPTSADSSSTEGCTGASPAHSSTGCAWGCCSMSRCPLESWVIWQTLQLGQENIVLQVLTTEVVQLSFHLRILKIFKSVIFTLETP